MGGTGDNPAGAVWVFTRSGGVWTQQGNKLVGAGAVGAAAQGQSVALSADGNTAIVGGPGDNSQIGAAWVYPAAAVTGPNRAISWSAPAQLETPRKAPPSRSPPTATPPLWAGLTIIRPPGQRVRIPTIATTDSDGSRPPVPIDRDQCGSGADGTVG